jgi:hypothetical protein
MHALMIVWTIGRFVLVGLLWHARPGDPPWFRGSMILGIGNFAAFWRYVTRPN